jgi:hypothetical protein
MARGFWGSSAGLWPGDWPDGGRGRFFLKVFRGGLIEDGPGGFALFEVGPKGSGQFFGRAFGHGNRGRL